jgi:phage tail-like protein
MTTQSYLLDERAGWRPEPSLSTDVTWSTGRLTLRPLPGFPQAFDDPRGTLGGLADPMAVAAGPNADIAVLDRAGRRVLWWDPCECGFVPVACLPAPVRGRDLAITDGGDLVVTDAGARRMVVVAGGRMTLRRVVAPLRAWHEAFTWRVAPVDPVVTVPADGVEPVESWPAGTWEPWGVAAGRGRLVVTDHANGLVHLFDEAGRWCAATDGSGTGLGPLVRPTAVAVDREANVYVLQSGKPVVRVLDGDLVGIAELTTLDDRRSLFCPVTVAVGPRGELCVAGPAGGACLVDVDRPPTPFAIGQVVRGLAFDPDGNPVAIDGQRGCVVRMVDAGGYPRQGRFLTERLDGRATECLWHRVVIRATIPPGGTVRVRTLTSEAPLSTGEIDVIDDGRWATDQVLDSTGKTTWDCLVTSDPARYLWLELTLGSDGVDTPVVHDAEVEFPRRSSLERLPGAYRSDADSTRFLDRFLSITDTVRASVVTALDDMPAIFDPDATPAGEDGDPDFLTWLAGWVGMADQEGLPIPRRRRLLRHAAELYRRRGTPEGVRMCLALFCGVEVRLLEHYRLRKWAIAGQARLGDCSQLFGPEIVRRLQLDAFSEIGSFRLVGTDDPLHDPFLVHANQFTLFLLAPDGHDEESLLGLAQRAAAQAKPAHTDAELVVVRPRLRVGIQATVGLDSVVGTYPYPSTVGAGRLGDGLALTGDSRRGGRAALGMAARVGLDSSLS